MARQRQTQAARRGYYCCCFVCSGGRAAAGSNRRGLCLPAGALLKCGRPSSRDASAALRPLQFGIFFNDRDSQSKQRDFPSAEIAFFSWTGMFQSDVYM
jgi:hypothetical protein